MLIRVHDDHPMKGRFNPDRQRISAVSFIAKVRLAVEAAIHLGVLQEDIAFATDVDGVVYDTGRTALLLRSFLTAHLRFHPGYERMMVEVAELFDNRRRPFYLPEDNWDHVTRGHVIEHRSELRQSWLAHWRTGFFSNAGVMADRLVPGVAQVLWQVKQQGAKVLHLTGRHEPEEGGEFPEGMREGTERALIRDNLPRDMLVCKPSFAMPDAAFKAGWFRETMPGGKPYVVGFMDNEPANVVAWYELARAAGRRWPLAVYVNTTCSRPVDLPTDIWVIDDFTLT